LIPIDVCCNPFANLKALRYINGYNPFFQNVQQILLEYNYQSLGIQSNFLSNINLMLLPIFVSPLFFLPLYLIGKKSKDYKTSPRCLKYAKSCLL
jgi:hypothetical protein